MSCCGCIATGSFSEGFVTGGLKDCLSVDLQVAFFLSFPLQKNHCINQMPPLDSSVLLAISPSFLRSWSQSWFFSLFLCSLGMDLFKWRRPASHPPFHHPNSPTEVLFSDTFNNTQHYWPDILMCRCLAIKRHLAAAYWASIQLEEWTITAVQESKCTTKTSMIDSF